jgi:hypothetical protein
MNPLIALQVKGPEIMTPYQLAAGAQALRSGDLENRINERNLEKSYEPEKLTEEQRLKDAIQKTSYVAHRVSYFVDKPYSPELDLQWRNTRKQIISDVGADIPSLPEKLEPETIKSVYGQGMAVGQDLAKKYQAISTTQGFAKFDPATGEYKLDENGFIAPNASPQLQGDIQQAKEAKKGVKVTDPTGSEYYAPQEQVNPEFAQGGNAPKGNNYGNLRPQGASTGFQSFETPEAGLSAIDQNLQSYGKQGINTLAGVISRWSPPNENDTPRLISEASKRLGISPDQPIDLNSPAVRQAISTAIMFQEHGSKGVFGQGQGEIIKSPSLQQIEQVKANIDIDKTRQQEAIKRESALGQTSDIKIRDSKEALNLLGNIDRLIDTSTGSVAGTMLDQAGNFVGLSTEGSKSIAALQTNAKKLVMMMPRGAGPQSDRDVALAEQMAGDLSNPRLPRETRKAALEELKRITSQYIPGAEVPSGYQPKGSRTTEDLLKLYGGE